MISEALLTKSLSFEELSTLGGDAVGVDMLSFETFTDNELVHLASHDEGKARLLIVFVGIIAATLDESTAVSIYSGLKSAITITRINEHLTFAFEDNEQLELEIAKYTETVH